MENRSAIGRASNSCKGDKESIREKKKRKKEKKLQEGVKRKKQGADRIALSAQRDFESNTTL